MLDAAVRQLAQARSSTFLATLMPETGQPHSSLVWAHADDEHILIGTNEARQKYRNVLFDPRVSLLILDPEDDRRYVEVRGRVVSIETGAPALELVQTTFGKWTGATAPFRVEADRVLFRISAERVRWKVARNER
jgi:PPOX class probable F420-dependent enzyme